MKTPLRTFPFQQIILLVLVSGLASCASAPPPVTSHDFKLRISTTPDVNPDVESRPSPIVLQVLQLARDDEFNHAEYFSLARNNAAVLGDDVINVTEIVLKPGESTERMLELDLRTAYLGLVAGYRDIEHATWRISQPVVPGKSDWISVNLSENQISIIEVND